MKFVLKYFLLESYCDFAYWLFRKSLDRKQTSEALLKSQQIFLSEQLRKFPYWANGHLSLGYISFYLDEIELAGASAIACLVLRNERLNYKSQMLLGKCHLKRSEVKEALEIFNKLSATNAHDPELIEELAACHFATGDYPAAEKLLNSIDPLKINQSAKAALEFCRLRNKEPAV